MPADILVSRHSFLSRETVFNPRLYVLRKMLSMKGTASVVPQVPCSRRGFSR
jgi:hypothetical protein